jgi:DNA-directed RNA polymerase subunit F
VFLGRFFMRNRLLLCLSVVPVFLCGMEKAENVVRGFATFKKGTDERYIFLISFAEAYRQKKFVELGDKTATFTDFFDKNKLYGVTYPEANEILYKFLKIIREKRRNKDDERAKALNVILERDSVFDKKPTTFQEVKEALRGLYQKNEDKKNEQARRDLANFEKSSVLQKYLLENNAMSGFVYINGNSTFDYQVFMNRNMYRGAWATCDVKKIKKSLDLSLYNNSNRYRSLYEEYKAAASFHAVYLSDDDCS